MFETNNKLTEGPIIKSLVALALPIILVNILQTAYQLTDTFWVGRLGTDEVAAVSISFPIIFLIISLGAGIAVAGTILVAQFAGKEDTDTVNHTASQTYLVIIVISAILGTIGYMLTPYLVSLMIEDNIVYPMAVSYMRISFIGIVFMFGYMVFQSLFRSVGNVKTPMIIVFVTVLLNLVLDPLFIFGFGPIPAGGVSGAAIATVFSQAIASLIGMYLLMTGKYGIKLTLKNFKPDFPLIKRMVNLGLPSSIEQSMRALGITVMTMLVTSFGTLAVAAYGLGTRILIFIIIPAMGLNMATSTLVGQNMGAGKIDRAEKIAKLSTTIGFIALTLVGIITFIFAREITAFFIPGEYATIEMSTLFVRIMALTFGFIAIQMTYNGTFSGSGNTMITMVLAIVSLWVLRFPLAYILSKHTTLGEVGLWVAFPISNIVGALITYLWFKKGTWKNLRLTETEKQEEDTREETIVESSGLG